MKRRKETGYGGAQKPVIPALTRLWQEEGCDFEASVSNKSKVKASLLFIVRPCLKKQNKDRQFMAAF